MRKVLICCELRYKDFLSFEHDYKLRYRINCDFLFARFENQKLQIMNINIVNHNKENLLFIFIKISISLIIIIFFIYNCDLSLTSFVITSALNNIETLKF